MKKIIILTIALLPAIVFCQTNRYTELSVSEYKSSTSKNDGYYYSPERSKKIAKQKSKQIFDRVLYCYEKMEDFYETTTFIEVKDLLEEGFSYLDPIVDKKPMTLYEAEWRLKKMKKKYNKAIRVHNRLIKK